MPSREEELNAECDQWHTVSREQRARIAALEAAIVCLNDVLNEMWGREDTKDFAPVLGARQIDKIMDAQNAAFALVEQK